MITGLFMFTGVVLVAVMLRFLSASEKASEVAVPSDTTVLHQGPANYKDGWLMVGGALKLTPEHLVFSAHGFAQSAKVHRWSLRDFKGASPSRTLGLVPNSFVAHFGETELKFVVTDREAWMQQIQAASAALGVK